MTAHPNTAQCRRLGQVVTAISFIDLAGPEPEPEPPAFDATPLYESVGDSYGLVPDPVVADARRAAAAFARGIVEGLCGRRSAGQFGDLVSARVVGVIARRAAADRHLAPPQPASLRLQVVSPRTAEVCVRLVRDGRSSALAFRIDRRRGPWRCTAIVVG